MITTEQLIEAMRIELKAEQFEDFTINGLQVQGKPHVHRIVTGVTACQRLLDEAVKRQADMILVHHGYFWRNETPAITNMQYRRLAVLLTHHINLVAWHLPLDAHPLLGNNAQFAARMGWEIQKTLDKPLGKGLVFSAELNRSIDHQELSEQLNAKLQRMPLVIEGHQRKIKKIAWCTGAAQDQIVLAAQAKMDAFISGEISERTTHQARELGVSYFAAGHHATERDGIKALGDWVSKQFDVTHEFVEIFNPA